MEKIVFEEKQFFHAAPFIFLTAALVLAMQLVLLPPSAKRIGNAFYWLPIAILVFLVIVSLNFWCLRIRVTREFFEARYGLLARRIPLKEIVDASACEIKFPNYWGLGIRWGFDGSTAYCTRFGGGVRLKLKRGRDFVVSTSNAAELLRVLKKR